MKLFSSACPNNHYGAKCAYSCGNCLSGTSCRQTDGFCTGGCEPEYSGLTCEDSKWHMLAQNCTF